MKNLHEYRKQIVERFMGNSMPRVGIAQGQKAVDDIDAKVLADLEIPENRQRLNMFIANILAKDYVNPWTPIKVIQQKLELVGLTLKLPPSSDSFPESGTVEYYPVYSFGGKIGMDPYKGWTDETRGTSVPFELRVSFEFSQGHWIVDAEIVTETEAEEEFDSAEELMDPEENDFFDEDSDEDFLDEDCGCTHKKKVNTKTKLKNMAKRRGETMEELNSKISHSLYNESSPPNAEIEHWIKSNKDTFTNKYGKKKGMSILYAKAWKMHNKKPLKESHTEIGVVKDILKFIENDKEFYGEYFLPCVKMLVTKIADDDYNDKYASMRLNQIITKAVKEYNKDTEEAKISLKLSDKNKILSALLKKFKDDVDEGIYDQLLDDKYEEKSLEGTFHKE